MGIMFLLLAFVYWSCHAYADPNSDLSSSSYSYLSSSSSYHHSHVSSSEYHCYSGDSGAPVAQCFRFSGSVAEQDTSRKALAESRAGKLSDGNGNGAKDGVAPGGGPPQDEEGIRQNQPKEQAKKGKRRTRRRREKREEGEEEEEQEERGETKSSGGPLWSLAAG